MKPALNAVATEFKETEIWGLPVVSPATPFNGKTYTDDIIIPEDSTNITMDFEEMKILYERPDLHEVFATNLNYFDNVAKPSVKGNINIWLLFQLIKYGFLNRNKHTLYSPKSVGGKLNPVYEIIKHKIQTVAYNATFNGYKDGEHLQTITNLMFLDIDNFNSEEEVLVYKNDIITKYQWIIMCCKSLSRMGLHIVINVDKILGDDDFNNKYDFISNKYFDDRLDPNAKLLIRHAIIPTDFNIHINENPDILEINKIIKFTNTTVPVTPYTITNNQNSTIIDNSKNNLSKIDNNSKNRNSIKSSYKEEKRIWTPYTFSPELESLEDLMNKAARYHDLIFKTQVDESFITDPDEPLYNRNGFETIEVNLFPYNNQKIQVGFRNRTLGAIGAQMILLNAERTTKENIETFMLNLNRKICEEPLEQEELKRSLKSNWEKYSTGSMNQQVFINKKRSLWSRKCRLTKQEKIRKSINLYYAPVKDTTRIRINDAIIALHVNGYKITQAKIAGDSGLNVQTVKNYWKEFKTTVADLNYELDDDLSKD